MQLLSFGEVTGDGGNKGNANGDTNEGDNDPHQRPPPRAMLIVIAFDGGFYFIVWQRLHTITASLSTLEIRGLSG